MSAPLLASLHRPAVFSGACQSILLFSQVQNSALHRNDIVFSMTVSLYPQPGAPSINLSKSRTQNFITGKALPDRSAQIRASAFSQIVLKNSARFHQLAGGIPFTRANTHSEYAIVVSPCEDCSADGEGFPPRFPAVHHRNSSLLRLHDLNVFTSFHTLPCSS